MDLSTAFGLLCAVVVLLALASDWHVYQKLAMVLMVAWASTNIAVELMGFDKAPVIIPSMDAVFALVVATIGYMNRSRIALVVFSWYGVVGSVWVGAYLMHAQSGWWCYATLDVLFLAQLLTVGAASAWMALRHWTAGRHKRARAYRPRW